MKNPLQIKGEERVAQSVKGSPSAKGKLSSAAMSVKETRQTHEPECNRYERMSTTLVNDYGIDSCQRLRLTTLEGRETTNQPDTIRHDTT